MSERSDGAIEQKLEALSAQVSTLVEHQRRRDELFFEFAPILKEMMAAATDELDELDRRGYFKFGREMLNALDNVVQGYSAGDVAALAASIVGILDTVRALTQPHVLKVVAQAGEVVERGDSARPVGLLGSVRATREEDVQRGIAVMLDVLRALGKGAEQADRRARMHRHLAPRSQRRGHPSPRTSTGKPEITKPTAKPTAKPATTGAVSAAAHAQPQEARTIAGAALTQEGFLADSQQWTPEIAVAIAHELGIAKLDDRHWQLVDAIRADYDETGSSPNIRRMAKVSGLSTRDIYALFPNAPGKCAAKIAGVPKPVGCI